MHKIWRKSRFWLGMASSLAFLWLAARQVAWPDVVSVFQYSDWKLIISGLFLMVVTWGVFAIRWRILLGSVAPVRWSDTFSYIMIGYLGNVMFPLRLGDVGRIALISRKYRNNVGFTSATVVVEKLLDVLIVVIFSGFLMFVTPIPEIIQRGVQAAAVVTIGLFAALILLARSQAVLTTLTSLLSDYLPRSVLELVFGILGKFAQGLQVTKSPSQMFKVSFLSLLSWCIACLSMLCFIRAFSLAVPWHAAALVLVVTNLGGAIPSSPGAIGVYEFLTVLSLSVWSLDRSIALGFAAFAHSVYLGLSAVLGLGAAWREGIQLSALTKQNFRSTENSVETFTLTTLAFLEDD